MVFARRVLNAWHFFSLDGIDNKLGDVGLED